MNTFIYTDGLAVRRQTCLYSYVNAWIGVRLSFFHLGAHQAVQELTCMSDPLILGSFSVTSPRCLQNQSWNAQNHRNRCTQILSDWH